VKRCTLVCDTATTILSCELQLPDEATIQVAVTAARALLGDGAVDWDRAATGVFGKVQPRTCVWQDGDRIELYRPLKLDPRAQRRQRAARAAK
jgi:putative ubiquitin-RnfH superfamily antitoxin RatB of RatAB toxin-antitoxin module